MKPVSALATHALATFTAFLLTGPAWGSTSIFANSESTVDSTTHAPRYRGIGGNIEVGVCIVPGTPNATDMERPLKNAIATWNGLKPTSANARRNIISKLDFESVLLHELGHCQGLGHTNLGNQAGVSGSRANYGASLVGGNGRFDTAPGPDGVIATADDARGDDVNTFRFFAATNDPYTLPDPVDATTYTRDASRLPTGDRFPVGSDHDVSALPRFRSRWSEAVMNQLTFGGEVQRTLAHDDVAGIRYARSGADHLQDNSDDYTVAMTYRGITVGTNAAPCDITAAMDASRTGFAFCGVRATFFDNDSNVSLVSAEMVFNPTFDWDFNPTPPCTASKALPENRWVQISLPCLVGVSTGNTVRAVLGDDLGEGDVDERWAVFTYEYANGTDGSITGAYRRLGLDDALESGVGYWLLTRDAGRSIDVQGEYPSQPDVPLGMGWNMVGNPFRNDSPWEEALVVSPADEVLTLAQSDPASAGTSGNAVGETDCTAVAVRPGCVVARFGYRYDPGTQKYEELGEGSSLGPFDASWVFSASPRARFRARMTGIERRTR